MPTAIYLFIAIALYSGNAAARGPHGGSLADAKLMVALALLAGAVAVGTAIKRHHPGIPQMLGGILIFMVLGMTTAGLLAALGVISTSNAPLAGLAIAVALPFVMTWIEGRRKKGNKDQVLPEKE